MVVSFENVVGDQSLACVGSYTQASNNIETGLHMLPIVILPIFHHLPKSQVHQNAKVCINGENLSVVAWFEQKTLINPSKCLVLDKSMGKTPYGHALLVLLKKNDLVTMTKVHTKEKISSKNKKIKNNCSFSTCQFYTLLVFFTIQ